jgi:2-isopropylmalate synthase
MREASSQVVETLHLVSMQIVAGSAVRPTATVTLERKGRKREAAEVGNGPVDAVYNAINRIVREKVTLDDYSVRSVTMGTDALGEATVRVRRNGEEAVGRAASTDVIEASAKAYLNAINRLLVKERRNEAQRGM